jgi:hypothetical protein
LNKTLVKDSKVYVMKGLGAFRRIQRGVFKKGLGDNRAKPNVG